MSNEAITWAYAQPITSGAKFVLVALADLADEAHSCFPGQAKLAEMTGQGERTVRRQLAELAESGYLERRRRFDTAGHRTSDRYVLPVGHPIPTGQNDHRPERPPAKMTTGQNDHRPNQVALPAKYDSPTGQNGQVSLREPPEEPSGTTTARARRLPTDWNLPNAWGVWALSEGLDEATVRREAAKFADFWHAKGGRDAAKLDWQATWRNWVRNVTDRRARASPKPTVDDKVRNTLAIAARLEAKESA